MKFLVMAMMVVCSITFINAQSTTQSGGGMKVDKNGIVVKGAKGGSAKITKGGASANGSKGKGVEATKSGTKTTPAKK